MVSDNTAQELKQVLNSLKQSNPDISGVSSKLKQLEDSQSCHYCKDELSMARKALEKGDITMATKAVEAGSIKFEKLSGLVTELDKRGLLGVDELMQQKYGNTSPSISSGSRKNIIDELGLADIMLDAADLIQDGNEIRKLIALDNLKGIIPPPNEVLPQLKLLKLPFLPPLPGMKDE